MTNRWTTNGTPEDGDGYDLRSTRTTMPTQIQPLTRRVSDGSSGLGVVAGDGSKRRFLRWWSSDCPTTQLP